MRLTTKRQAYRLKSFCCHCLQTLQGQYEAARQQLTSSHQEVQTCKAQLHQAQQSLLELKGKMLETEQPLQQMVKRAQVAEAALCKSRCGAGPLPCCMSTRQPAPTPAVHPQGKLELPGRPAGACGQRSAHVLQAGDSGMPQWAQNCPQPHCRSCRAVIDAAKRVSELEGSEVLHRT